MIRPKLLTVRLSEGAPVEAADSPRFSSAPEISPEEREMRAEIALIASEGGRFASRLTRMALELMARGRGEGWPDDPPERGEKGE